MKIDKNAANAYACYEEYNKQYYVYCALKHILKNLHSVHGN